MSPQFMKRNLHHSFLLILSCLSLEFLLLLFSFQLPHKKEAQRSIFTSQNPSEFKVFISLLGSFIIELIKERKSVYKLLYPHQVSTDFEERVGMPPSYMVVELTWDDDEEQLATKNIEKSKQDSIISTFSEGKSFIQDDDLLKIHVTLSMNKQVLRDRLNAQLSVIITKFRSCSRRTSNADKALKPVITENYEEICHLLTSNFNIFVVSSAVGVVITLALKNQSLILKQQQQYHKAQILCTTIAA